MTATVGLRSGLSKHWTGSLLELNCNSPESPNDYFDPSNENPFYVHWRSDEPNVLESLQKLGGNGYVRVTGENSWDTGIHPKNDKQEFNKNGYTGTTKFTPNRLFRLRQLVSLLHRNFHHRYGKNNRGIPEHFSWHSSDRNPIEVFDLSISTDSNLMGSPESSDNKLVPSLFDPNPSLIFPNGPSFVLITKSKRRHYSSEGDLTLITSGNCHNIPHDRLFSYSRNTTASSSEHKESPTTETADIKDKKENPSEINHSSACPDVNTIEEDDSSTDQSTIGEVSRSTTSLNTISKYGWLPNNSNNNCDQEEEQILESSFSLTSIDVTESVTNEDKLHCTVSKPPTTLNIPSNSCTTLFNRVISDTRLTKSELSTPLSGKIECKSSTASSSRTRMGKSVSFADETGRSLTEVFLFRKTEEESLIPEYEDDFEGPLISFVRKSRPCSFGRFSRTRRGTDDNYHNDMSSTIRKPMQKKELADPGRYLWFLGFAQPAAQYYEFRQRVENCCVSLENITLTQPEDYGNQLKQPPTMIGKSDGQIQSQPPRLPYLSGSVKVKNVHFEKKVWLRVTTNHWVTFKDVPATYDVQLSSDSNRGAYGRFDTFTFQISSADYPCDVHGSERIEFAVRYCTGADGSHGQFWDNNEGRNYVVERRRVESTWTSPTNSSPTLLNTAPAYTGLSGFTSLDTNPSQSDVHRPYTTDYRPNFSGISSFTDYRAWEHFASEPVYY